MKKKIILSLTVVGILLISLGIFQGFKSVGSKIEEHTLSELKLTTLSDGLYKGVFETSLVSAEVDVKIRNGEIEDIIIINHNTLLGKKAEIIIGTIIDEQSLEVDNVAGATYSSEVIKRAVFQAID